MQQETLHLCLFCLMSASPLLLQSSFSLCPSFSSLKHSSSRSFSRRKRGTLGDEVSTLTAAPNRSTQICIVSTVHNLSTTFPPSSPHLSEQTPPPRRRPPPLYTLHTTSYFHQSEARAGRQTWKAHSYNGGSIRSALGRRRQGCGDGRPSGGGGAGGALSEWSL